MPVRRKIQDFVRCSWNVYNYPLKSSASCCNRTRIFASGRTVRKIRTGIKILEDHNMKKFLAMLLAVLTVCSFAACAAKPAENDTADVEIADALTLLNTVWASYTDDEKFPAAGGDYDEANMTDGAPGKVGLGDASSVEYLVSVPADVVSKFDDAASLFHMMNLNTFTCGAYRLKDAADVDSVAAAIKEYVMGKQWMCGFPDKLIVVSVGNYIVECFGAEDLVNTFRDKLAAAYPSANVITDEAIAIE